ncbi:MAG: hypothetical protein LBD99_00370 [Candidatus Margulisbacteria bacterium]|jgi:microcystin-dependent protein|nr:hypothetical protein [Candidatus Margulisiibacteriota bacterium]
MTRILQTEIKTGERLVATDITDLTFFPIGTILQFSGSEYSRLISARTADNKVIWTLCNGTAVNGISVPNLVDKFLRGAASSGATGGGAAVLTEANLPAHTHSISGTASSAGGHTHTYEKAVRITPSDTDNYGGMRDLSYETKNTSTAGAHTHVVSGTATANSVHTAASFDIVPKYYTVVYIIKVA